MQWTLWQQSTVKETIDTSSQQLLLNIELNILFILNLHIYFSVWRFYNYINFDREYFLVLCILLNSLTDFLFLNIVTEFSIWDILNSSYWNISVFFFLSISWFCFLFVASQAAGGLSLYHKPSPTVTILGQSGGRLWSPDLRTVVHTTILNHCATPVFVLPSLFCFVVDFKKWVFKNSNKSFR